MNLHTAPADAPGTTETEPRSRSQQPAALVVATAVAALFTVANAVIHLREWATTYRQLPGQIPGVWVVKVGFPVQAALALLLAAALVVALLRGHPPLSVVAIAGALFAVGSIGALVLTREASLLGWSERSWAGAPTQAVLVEAVALVALMAVVLLRRKSSG